MAQEYDAIQLNEWIERWDQEYMEGQTTISRAEAIRRWDEAIRRWDAEQGND